MNYKIGENISQQRKRENEHRKQRELEKEKGWRFHANMVAKNPNMMGEMDSGSRHYHCRIRYGDGCFEFFYSMGSGHKNSPTVVDVLPCLVMDADSFLLCYPDPWAYIDELGYDTAESAKDIVHKYPEWVRQSCEFVGFLKSTGLTPEDLTAIGVDEDEADRLRVLIEETP